ncbi:hypothetical protein HY383_03190 [Candidatus Daviesbacteria bacterium]|nr:hypothetical protein [Candidatus Daviesbacteria bacterium]
MERDHKAPQETLADHLRALSKPRFLRRSLRMPSETLADAARRRANGGEISATATLLQHAVELSDPQKLAILIQAYDKLADRYLEQALLYEEQGLLYVARGWQYEAIRIRNQRTRLGDLSIA